ncbi:MAG: hypothetical protein HQL03_00250 [Nitrospirae bacterium]|nr:hypothetical protein [Nitrospirota bacterium]MBF0591144.1 hypothetical protein [Nitrospirota bacterium]
MKRLFLVLMLVMLCVVGAFQYSGADDTGRSPFYVGAGTGIVWRAQSDDWKGRVEYGAGPEFTATVGARLEGVNNKFLQNFRVELEYSTERNDFKWVELHQFANKRENTVGHATVDSFMTVIYYDFPIRKLAPSTTGFFSHLSPYVGLGLGFDRLSAVGLSSPTLDFFANLPVSQGGLGKNGAGFHLHSTTDFVFAISPRFGITYELSKHFDVYLAAKFIKSNNFLADDYASSSPNGFYTQLGYTGWDGQFGVRYNF